MWNPLKTEVSERFSAVEEYFKATRGLGGSMAQTARGLAFVQMYAVYEYTATAVFRIAIDALVAHRHPTKSLIPPLLALFLNSKLQSLRDCSEKDVWDRRIKLFEGVFSNNPAQVENTVFPKDGSHYRHRQLQTMFDVLGIKRTPAQRRKHLLRIDEVVGHRNAIAHGRETPEAVGKRYTRTEVAHIIRQMKSVCLLLIKATETHCADANRHCRS